MSSFMPSCSQIGGRRVASGHAGARGFPHRLARRGIEGEDRGVGFQIADEDDQAVGEDRRGAAAEVVVRLGAWERVTPQLLASES